MELIEKFAGKIIFIDTAPLIYFIEGHSVFAETLSKLFQENEKGSFHFITSTLTFHEVLVKPFREKRFDLIEKYEHILTNSKTFSIIDINHSISKISARIRAEYDIKTPDAIQIAVSLEYFSDFFLTNDLRLKKIKEIEVVSLSEIAEFPH